MRNLTHFTVAVLGQRVKDGGPSALTSGVPMTQAEKLRRLFAGPMPLVLINAWDAGSARVLERSGARAIGLSAAGIAWALGHAEVQALSHDELIAACARVRRVTTVPVVVDVGGAMPSSREALHEVAYAVNRLEAAGIVVRDEWVEGTPAEASDDILAARVAALQGRTAEGDPARMVIVRVGGYMTDGRSRDAHSDVIRRAQRLADVGADAVFVPAADTHDIVPLVRSISAPVAVDIGDGWGPAVHGLARAGVRCVVVGAAPMCAAISAMQIVAEEAIQYGTCHAFARRVRLRRDAHPACSTTA